MQNYDVPYDLYFSLGTNIYALYEEDKVIMTQDSSIVSATIA